MLMKGIMDVVRFCLRLRLACPLALLAQFLLELRVLTAVVGVVGVVLRGRRSGAVFPLGRTTGFLILD